MLKRATKLDQIIENKTKVNANKSVDCNFNLNIPQKQRG